MIKLAARGGAFDLGAEFGIPAERLAALDRTTQLAIGAGIDALRDAGIPLVMRYHTTTKGTRLPERCELPEPLRDETGMIFASAFPGYDAFAADLAALPRRPRAARAAGRCSRGCAPGSTSRPTATTCSRPRWTASSHDCRGDARARSPTRSTAASCSACSPWATRSSPS